MDRAFLFLLRRVEFVSLLFLGIFGSGVDRRLFVRIGLGLVVFGLGRRCWSGGGADLRHVVLRALLERRHRLCG